MNTPKIRQMDNTRGDGVVKNQFIIITEDGEYFQSYQTIIAFRTRNGKISLDNDWNYSTTTGKYRNQFLGEGIDETRKKIASGEYIVTNLNEGK